MNIYAAAIISIVISVALLVLPYFLGYGKAGQIETFFKKFGPRGHKFVLFVLPFFITFLICSIFSMLRLSNIFEVFQPVLLLICIWCCSHFAGLVDRKYSTPAYGSKKEDDSVLFSNYVICCLLFVCVSYMIGDFIGVTIWASFVFGRFVWLDGFDSKDESGFMRLKEGLKKQRWPRSVLYSLVSLIVLYIVCEFAVAINIPTPIALGISVGLEFGIVLSFVLILIAEHRRHIKKKQASQSADKK